MAIAFPAYLGKNPSIPALPKHQQSIAFQQVVKIRLSLQDAIDAKIIFRKQ